MTSIDSICCQGLMKRGTTPSPFQKLLSLGYKDGTISGVAQCGGCLKSYRYELLAWDGEQECRIYSLAEIPQESFERIEGVFKGLGMPRWPVWQPIWRFHSAADEKSANQKVDAELRRAASPTWVVASTDLGKEILAAARLDENGYKHLSDSEEPSKAWLFWRPYLGLGEAPV